MTNRALPLLLYLLLALPAHATQAPVQALEKADLVKAATIEKIVRFIEWPRSAEGSFVLCVTTDHPQLAALRAYYENSAIDERPVAIQIIRKGELAATCRLLFLAPRDLGDLARLKTTADREHVLLIAEGTGAARSGAHIAFYSDSGRLKLEVNRRALEASGLKASFRLLEMAKLVE